MTNSFLSTAFQSATSPVDTFVQPVTVQPKSGAEELAEILEAVNPALQKFIGQKLEDKVEEEKRRAIKDRIFAEINNGEVAKVSNNIRKKDGDDAAKKIIGGSRIYKLQYE